MNARCEMIQSHVTPLIWNRIADVSMLSNFDYRKSVRFDNGFDLVQGGEKFFIAIHMGVVKKNKIEKENEIECKITIYNFPVGRSPRKLKGCHKRYPENAINRRW